MSDDPFRNRPEDFINRGLKATVSALPVVGGALGEFVSFVIGDPAQERRDAFMRDLYERIQKLATVNERATDEQLHENAQFQATFIQAAQTAARTVQNEKKAILRNAVLNAAVGDIDENVRQIFMQFIERFTPMHVSLLAALHSPADFLDEKKMTEVVSVDGALGELARAAVPSLSNSWDLFPSLLADLEAAKLLDANRLEALRLYNSYPAKIKIGSTRFEACTTKLGKAFLLFISDPETGSLST